MRINADLSGIGSYIGAVDGIVEAVESPGFKGDFVGTLMSNVRKTFMTDTIAAYQSGYGNLHHVFEWGDQDSSGVSTGRPSSIPLFKLTKGGRGENRVLSYTFLPSVKPVPLPDPSKYGFKPNKLQYLRRHIFQMKALVMETHSSVTIAPRYTKKLFIPDERSRYGYYMTSNPKRINPGGPQTTGAFTKYWMAWMESRAQGIATSETKKAETIISKTGQKVVRYAAGTRRGGKAVGGQFARGHGVSFGYINGISKKAQAQMQSELKTYYNDEEWVENW